jgi:hypothetical protein
MNCIQLVLVITDQQFPCTGRSPGQLNARRTALRHRSGAHEAKPQAIAMLTAVSDVRMPPEDQYRCRRMNSSNGIEDGRPCGHALVSRHKKSAVNLTIITRHGHMA